MIVKIFCAVLVVLGVSVAIVLGGLIILASCASVRKSLLVTIPLMTRTHLCTQIICRDFTYNFFYPAKLFIYYDKVGSALPISILHFLYTIFILSLAPKTIDTARNLCYTLNKIKWNYTQKGRFIMTEKEKCLLARYMTPPTRSLQN